MCADAGPSLPAPVAIALGGADVHLWWASVAAAPPTDRCVDCLSVSERLRTARLRRAADRRRFVVGRWLLRNALSRHAPLAPGEWALAFGEHGKPRVHERCAYRPSFNLSHSGEWCVLAVTAAPAVGIDLETARPARALERLAAGYLSAAERREARELAPEARRRRLLDLWMLKEAHAKAVGAGLTLPLERLVFARLADGDPVLADAPDGNPGRWAHRLVDLPAGRVAVCLRRPPPEPSAGASPAAARVGPQSVRAASDASGSMHGHGGLAGAGPLLPDESHLSERLLAGVRR